MTTSGWHDDPYGRHEHRYWNGERWTDDVADGGLPSLDPVQPSPEPTAGPGWQNDPLGSHEHRYWDGESWTDDVADGGVPSVDPIDAGPQVATATGDPVDTTPPAADATPVASFPPPEVPSKQPDPEPLVAAYPPPIAHPTDGSGSTGDPGPPTTGKAADDRRPKILIGVGVAAALVLLIGVIAAIGGGDDDGGGSANGAAGGSSESATPSDAGSWTVLVYQMADNDLELFAVQDLLEMASAGAGSSENLNLVVMSDRAEGQNPEEGQSSESVLNLADWQSTKILQVVDDELVEISDLGEADMDDPAVLADFVAMGLEQFPADNHAVVLWDHGGGWTGMGGDYSEDIDSVLTLPEIGQGLSDGLARTGVDQLDLVGFDACLMATYEVGREMAPIADFMIASQENEPGHGWDWTALDVLADGPVDVVELGGSILDGYQGQAEDFDQGAGVTLSMTDLGALDAVADDLDAMVGAVAADIDSYAPLLGQENTQNLSFGRAPNPEDEPHLTDLGQLTEGLAAAGGEAGDLAETVSASLADAIVDTIAGPVAEGAQGLSIYFPPTEELFALAGEVGQDYEAAADDIWGPLLDSYYAAGDAIPEEDRVSFDRSGGNGGSGEGGESDGVYSIDEEGLGIEGTFAGGETGNIAEAVISYGIPFDDGTVVYVGEEPGLVTDDGTAEGFWDLTSLVVSDGETEVNAYIELGYEDESEITSIDVPFVYTAPGGGPGKDIILSLILDADFTVLSETYYAVQANGTLGEFTADPTGTIVPDVLVELPDGSLDWVPFSDEGLLADTPSLEYEFIPFLSGEPVYAQLTVTDFGGNSDAISAEDVVP